MDDPAELRDRAVRLRTMARFHYGDSRDTLTAAAAELDRIADALERQLSDLTAHTAPGRDQHTE